VASLSQGRTAAAQCGLFTHKSVPVIFEPPCNYKYRFQVILLLFRLRGRPLIAHSRSLTNTVYNVVNLGCVYITGVGFFMDTIVHRHEMAYAEKKFGLCIAFLLIIWIHVTFR